MTNASGASAVCRALTSPHDAEVDMSIEGKCLTLALGWLTITGGAALAAGQAAPGGDAGASIEHGRYLVKITGCNDCHTPGYNEAAGNLPEEQWLTGNPVGYRGPWGTTYAVNVRLFVQEHSEDEWLHEMKTEEMKPPMPWFNVRAMTESDLRSMYRFIKSLGPAGEPAPAFVPPGEEPETSFVLLEPQEPVRD
jgi:mono/diheme cytochrome c family protein